jgi:ATP-binding cassette subfamily A (ABC1) protein 5
LINEDSFGFFFSLQIIPFIIPFFTEPDTCQSIFPPLLNMMAFIPYIVVGIVDGNGNAHAARILHFVLCFVDPPYTLLGALYFVFRVNLVANASLESASVTVGNYFTMDNNILPTLLIMWGELFLFFGLILAIERGFFRQRVAADSGEPSTSAHSLTGKQDDDVQAEKARCHLNDARGSPNALIRVDRLHKSYPIPYQSLFGFIYSLFSPIKNAKVAVKEVSFIVEKGEIFSLLGPNGVKLFFNFYDFRLHLLA